ncbi:MAG: GNAT family N-acetyltransferase [Actinomycetales bacterium]|nr:GNAT family N-acetyltransferase [Actinomycetales bacterium]
MTGPADLPEGVERIVGGRMLLADRHRWTLERTWSDDRAALVMVRVAHSGRRSVVGTGAPDAARRLVVAAAAEIGRVDWLTLPRLGAGPAGVQGEPEDEGPALEPDRDLPAVVRDRLGVEPATAWDRMALDHAPGVGSLQAQHLDLALDLDAIRGCLEASNPGSQADPAAPDEAGWFGVRDGGRLVGVIGASLRAGDPGRSDVSWHLHGLGVLPQARSRGLGQALTATAARAGFDAGADWVSLGMYASNTPARRVYLRLGFAVEGRFTSYRPPAPAADEPPAR